MQCGGNASLKKCGGLIPLQIVQYIHLKTITIVSQFTEKYWIPGLARTEIAQDTNLRSHFDYSALSVSDTNDSSDTPLLSFSLFLRFFLFKDLG